MENMKKILIVDDDTAIQRSLRRSFFQLPYRIFMASSGRDAIQILDNEKIDLVISDYKMPEMNGVQFLNKVKESHPSVIRILISGYIDKDKLMESLFQFNVVSLFPKPWDEDILHRRIEDCLNLKDEIEDDNLWNALNSHNLLSLHNSDFHTDKNLIDYIVCEPALYSGLLHIYNSDYYNGGQQLDLKVIEEHFTSESIKTLLKESSENYNFSSTYYFFQKHSQKLNSLFFMIKDEVNDSNHIGESIPPSFINLFRHIVWICDKELFEERINKHFFIKENNNGKILLNSSIGSVFEYVLFFLRLWDIVEPLRKFAYNILKCFREGGFSKLKTGEKLLLISDYYIEKYRDLNTEDIGQILIKDLYQNKLLEV